MSASMQYSGSSDSVVVYIKSPSWVILATKRQNLPAWLKLWIGGWLRCWLADTHGNAVGDVTYT